MYECVNGLVGFFRCFVVMFYRIIFNTYVRRYKFKYLILRCFIKVCIVIEYVNKSKNMG